MAKDKVYGIFLSTVGIPSAIRETVKPGAMTRYLTIFSEKLCNGSKVGRSLGLTCGGLMGQKLVGHLV
jgi:hypothetical protein